MADTKREQIVQKILAGLRGIKVANNYPLDIVKVEEWRSASFSAEELPALIVRDLDEPVEQHYKLQARHIRELHIQVEALAHGTDSPQTLRKMLAAIEQYIRSENKADALFDGLAFRIRPHISRLVVEQESKKIAGGIFECHVDYITGAFDSYN